MLSAFGMLLTADHTDAIVRRAIELARARIGLRRVGVFLLDDTGSQMLGTWGSDLQGELVDEHHVMYEFGASGVDVFRRAELEGQHFTVLDNCPIVVQKESVSEVVGRGWVACTPIRSPRNRIGIMFNDSGLSGEPVDGEKQARAAMLCSLLGSVIDLARAQPAPAGAMPAASPKHPAVQKTIEMLAADPSLTGKEIAASLAVGISQLVRWFKADLRMPLVEYRNRLRLERFQVLVDAGEANLLEAARASGFGSYAQFHRVFRTVYGAAPRDYLRGR
jgi:AraC-like DNA-binding protein